MKIEFIGAICHCGQFDAENTKTKFEAFAAGHGNIMKPMSNCRVRLMDSLVVQQRFRQVEKDVDEKLQSDKEKAYFLRELFSKSSDALDQI